MVVYDNWLTKVLKHHPLAVVGQYKPLVCHWLLPCPQHGNCYPLGVLRMFGELISSLIHE